MACKWLRSTLTLYFIYVYQMSGRAGEMGSTTWRGDQSGEWDPITLHSVRPDRYSILSYFSPAFFLILLIMEFVPICGPTHSKSLFFKAPRLFSIELGHIRSGWHLVCFQLDLTSCFREGSHKTCTRNGWSPHGTTRVRSDHVTPQPRSGTGIPWR